jgi:TonB family protein
MTPEQMLQARQLVMEWKTAHPSIPAANKGFGYGIGTGIGGGIGAGAGFGVASGSGRGGSVAGSVPYTVGPGVTAPVQLVHPQPPYTDAARNSRIEGEVVFQCIVRKDGTVDSFKILQVLGYGLDESAVRTVASQWRFRPGAFKGNPVDVQTTISVLFKLY